MNQIDVGTLAPKDEALPEMHYADQWSLAQECDEMWWTRAREWGGGVFHHRNALVLGPPAGTPLIATCVDSVGVAAVAVGTRHGCRLSRKSRHAFFPSLPMVRPGVDFTAVARSLCDALLAQGIDAAVFDSFDASPASLGISWGIAGADRAEYRVALDATPAELRKQLSSSHARMVNRGERDGWRLDTNMCDEAPAALTLVTQSATERGASRGNPFSVTPWQLDCARSLTGTDWGITICRAMKGDELLAAALIGWGGSRAFYISGGSTPAGYECGAAPWMHWRTMLDLRERGITCYNLGGAPARATEPSHPSHGLHRFKTAFGAERVPLRGLQWTAGSVHTGLHRAARRLSDVDLSGATTHSTEVHAS